MVRVPRNVTLYTTTNNQNCDEQTTEAKIISYLYRKQFKMHCMKLSLRTLFFGAKSPVTLIKLCANTSVRFNHASHNNLIKETLLVEPHFGKISLTSCCNCEISPLDPLIYPSGNMASISLWGDSLINANSIEIFLAGERKDDLRIQIYPPNSNIFCKIELPIIYDIEAILADKADITIYGMESQDVSIRTEYGNVTLKKLKGQNSQISMNSGSFNIGGYLHGNLYLDAKNAIATIDHLQGNECNFQANNLKLNLGSCYVTEGSFFANEADLLLNHLHGKLKSYLRKGKMHINGMSGSLHSIVENGEVAIKASNLFGKSFVQVSDGRLDISISDMESQSLHIKSPSLHISEELKKFGTESISDGGKASFNFGSSDTKMEGFVGRGKASADLQPFSAHGFNLNKR